MPRFSALLLCFRYAPATRPLRRRAPPPADQGANANVVVIAQHTTTKLQKIPVAVSVFTGASRDRIGISTVQEVTNFAPGFVYDPSTVHAYIRGVGRQSVNVTDDQRVATYEDEFYVYSPYGLEKSSLFLSQEQIERGPQNVGGRQAAAGSIDMISVRPTSQPYAELRGTVSNFNHYELEGAVSGQIAPGLTARASGFWNDQEQGFYKNVAGGPSEGNHIKEWYIEGQLAVADQRPRRPLGQGLLRRAGTTSTATPARARASRTAAGTRST